MVYIMKKMLFRGKDHLPRVIIDLGEWWIGFYIDTYVYGKERYFWIVIQLIPCIALHIATKWKVKHHE